MSESEFGCAFDFTSTPIRYLCTICKKTFTFRDELIDHKRSQHPEQIKKIVPVPRTRKRPESVKGSPSKEPIPNQPLPPPPTRQSVRANVPVKVQSPPLAPVVKAQFISKGQRKIQIGNEPNSNSNSNSKPIQKLSTNNIKINNNKSNSINNNHTNNKTNGRIQMIRSPPKSSKMARMARPPDVDPLAIYEEADRAGEEEEEAAAAQIQIQKQKQNSRTPRKGGAGAGGAPQKMETNNDIDIQMEKFLFCPICRAKFIDLSKLRSHVTSVHSNSQLVVRKSGPPPGVSLSKAQGQASNVTSLSNSNGATPKNSNPNPTSNSNSGANNKVKVKQKSKDSKSNFNIITLKKAQLTTMAMQLNNLPPAEFVYNNRNKSLSPAMKMINGQLGSKSPSKRKIMTPTRKEFASIDYFLAPPDSDSNLTLTSPLTSTLTSQLTHKEKFYVRSNRIFLIRALIENSGKMGQSGKSRNGAGTGEKRGNERIEKIMTIWAARFKAGSPSSKYQSLQITHKDPKLTHLVQQAQIFHQLFITLTTAKDGTKLLCEPFMNLSKRGRRRRKVLDLNVIGKRILAGFYSTISELEADICTVVRLYKPSSPRDLSNFPLLLEKVKSVYMSAKTKALTIIEPFILNLPLNLRGGNSGSSNTNGAIPSIEGHPGTFLPPEKNDWVIRCVCGTFSEEGFMIQCDRCGVWQHGNCMRITNPETVSDSEYYCEMCIPRFIDPEVPLSNGPIVDDPSGRVRHYTLVREDGFMVRRLDNVYILRDNSGVSCSGSLNSTNSGRLKGSEGGSIWGAKDHGGHGGQGQGLFTNTNYKAAGPLVPKDCDVLHIEDLWIEADGSRWVFGCYFYRPEETFIRPGQKFYPNELMISPHRQIIPLDAVHGQCWVLDPATFCKGRPVGCGGEEHVYICEFRVDKKAWYTTKVNKRQLNVCMKPFAFQYFETKLQIQRNFHPYGPPCPEFAFSFNGSTPGKKDESSNKNLGWKNLGQQGVQKQTRVNALVDGLEKKIPNFLAGRVEGQSLWLRPTSSNKIAVIPQPKNKRGRKRKNSYR